MGLFEGKTPAERNKTLAAMLLPLIALVLLLRMFFGGDSRPAPKVGPKPTPTPLSAVAAGGGAQDLVMPTALPEIIKVSDTRAPSRNIFAFYVPPVRTTTAAAAAPTEIPTPTPAPPPPLNLGSVSPANVFARTADFNLEVAGDKFTPDSRVFVEGQELPTTFKSAQSLAAKVPAALITAQGARTVEVKTPDNRLYSNTATFNVMPAPTPQVAFIGVLGAPGYARDKAILKPNQSNDLLTVQRNDVVGGRFKVVNISERAVEFLDTQLNLKHSVPFTDAKNAGLPSNSPPRGIQPPQKADDDDDDPQQR
jgi:hypothetical protein